MRSVFTVSLLLVLAGCGAITPAEADAEAAAAPAGPDAGVKAAKPNEPDDGMTKGDGKHACDRSAPPCSTEQQ